MNTKKKNYVSKTTSQESTKQELNFNELSLEEQIALFADLIIDQLIKEDHDQQTN